jgi:hypothetical protein
MRDGSFIPVSALLDNMNLIEWTLPAPQKAVGPNMSGSFNFMKL